MSLQDRGQSYMSKGFKMILLFAILGCVILVIAVNYIGKVFSDVLPADPNAAQSGTTAPSK